MTRVGSQRHSKKKKAQPKICELSGFLSGVIKDYILLSFDAASLGNMFPTFRHNIAVQSSRVLLDTLTNEHESTTTSRNVGNQLPNDEASCIRKEKRNYKHR